MVEAAKSFPAAAIREAIAECEEKEAFAFSSEFRRRAEKNPEYDWAMLADIFGFMFQPRNPINPFRPVCVLKDGRRSMVPDDLTNAQLDELQNILGKIDDPEFIARIADVIWLRRRDVKTARLAVESYLASGKRLEDPENWVHGMERYERALRLARQIVPKGELPQNILQHIQDRVLFYDGQDPSYLTLRALELLAEFRFGDFPVLANIADRVAQRSRQGKDFRKARSYFDVESKLLVRAGLEEEAESARVRSAECHVEEAEDREEQGSFMAARVFWQEAIQAFQNRPSLRERLPELHKRLAIAGKKTLAEMKVISHEVDIREVVEAVENEFKGLPLAEALCRFGIFLQLISPDALREEVLKGQEEIGLHALIDADIFDEAGRKIGRRPSIASNDEKERQKAIEGLMDQNARLMRHFAVNAYIVPAMRTILSEHTPSESDIEALIKDSEFIADGRLPFFVRAIIEGFSWDISTSLHLFVPQAEASLRHLLEQRGVSPRTMKDDGVEEVWSMERTLQHPLVQQILGPSFLYELQSLLVGRLGPNLRNLIAHGLISRDALQGESGFYLWWVLYRLTIAPTSAFRAYVAQLENAGKAD